MKTQFTFCVAHRVPLVPEHLYDCAIGLGEYLPEKGTHVSTLDPFWHEMRRLAYGAAGTYAARHAIRTRASSAEVVGLFQYRKFVARNNISSEFRDGPLHEISVASSARIRPEDVHPQDGHEYLVPSPVALPEGLVQGYATYHHAIDLFEYALIAVQLGVMSPAELAEFARETIFIPGGCELGIYPAAWLEAILGKLALVGQEFLNRHGERILTYDSFQVRAIGFLSEWVGSYLLHKELRARYPDGIPEGIFGALCVVVPDGERYSPGLTDT